MQLVILSGPTIIMVIVVLAVQVSRSIPQPYGRWGIIGGLLLLFACTALGILIAPGDTIAAFRRSVVAFWPAPLMVGIAGIFIESGLHNSQRVSWWRIVIGATLVILACLLLAVASSRGYLAPVLAVLAALAATGTAIVTALWMIWSLPSWRKVSAFIIGVIIPGTLLSSICLGTSLSLTGSPEAITRRNGDLLVQALHRYYVETEKYPTKLTELVPDYFDEVPDALTTQGTGWLYTANGSQYTLGYWSDPRWFGVNLCLHSSESKAWQCKYTYSYQDWSPFSPVPTPTPKP